MPPADAGSGLIFVENEGLTALATIMPPTFVGLKFRSPLARHRFANGRFVDDGLIMPMHHLLRRPANLNSPVFACFSTMGVDTFNAEA